MSEIEIWIERLNKGNWTDVKIKPPKVGEKVVVLMQCGRVEVAKISGSGTWYDWQIAFEYGFVTHWMPHENIILDWI